MITEKMSLLSNLKFSSVEKINKNFLKAKCYVMALGKNRNRSHFSKENVDRAYPTLAFSPVIGHLMFDDNGVCHLGGHDMKLDLKDLTFKSQCVPFGVALPSETPVYEDVIEDDGTIATYLTCEVAIWINRFPELADAFYSDEIFTNQSMEIYYSKHEALEEDPDYTDIIDFSFDALCMLHKSLDDRFNVTPCFPSASIVSTSYSADMEEFSQLLNEMKNELVECFGLNNSEPKGGNTLDEKMLILEKFNKTVEELEFSIEDLSVEELETKMEELFGQKKPVSDPEPTPGAVAFSATYNQKREALRNALDPIIIKDDDGNYIEETYFYVEDFSDEYVFVEKCHWSENNRDCKYGRFAYAFDESTLEASITGEFEEMVMVWLTLEEKAQLDNDRAGFELLKTEFETYKNEHSVSNEEFEVLKQYKENKELEEREIAEDALFAEYEECIGGTEEFGALKEKASEFTLEELKKECLCIVGMYSMTTKPKDSKPESIKFGLDPEMTPAEDKPYGGLVEHYLGR